MLGVEECTGLATSLQNPAWAQSRKFDLKVLYEKSAAVYGKDARNTGER